MQELLRRIAEALVDYPGKVQVSCIEGRNSTVLELMVAKKDVGKIIGKRGRIISAIRTILNAAAAKDKKRAVLELLE